MWSHHNKNWTFLMACIALFETASGKQFSKTYFGSLEDCTIDATNFAEDNGYELLIIEEK